MIRGSMNDNVHTVCSSLPRPWVAQLLRWYRANRRDLPWRGRVTPYAVWVSEIMLQQTQVDTVIPYYQRFMRRFPTVRKLASADLQVVLKMWEGLGYYARARNLHRAALVVAEQNKGRMPRTFAELRTLPGIGDYTAAAISSISFGEAQPVVDGNVLRVFCRFWLIRDDIRLPRVKRRLTELLCDHIPHDAAGDFNQAIMELGALVCRPTSPACDQCPLKAWCRALAAGEEGELPVKSRRAPIPEYRIAVGVIHRGGKILIARRPADGMLGGMWEFPGGKRHAGESPQDTVVRETREEMGIEIAVGERLCTVRHTYSHFRIVMDAFICRHVSGRARPLASDEVQWVAVDKLDAYPFPTANKKILEQLSKRASGYDR